MINIEITGWKVDRKYLHANGPLNSKLSRSNNKPACVLAKRWNTLWVFSQEDLDGQSVSINGVEIDGCLVLDDRSKWRGHGKHNLKLTDKEEAKVEKLGYDGPSANKEPKVKVSGNWNPQIHAENAMKDGLTPNDFPFMNYPVSNVHLSHPVGPEYGSSQWVMAYQAEMPSNTPQLNVYDDKGNKIPDPVGTALAWVEFNLVDVSDGRILDKDTRDHNSGNVRGGMTTDRSELWNRLTPGSSINVKLDAEPVFFPYVDKNGSGKLDYANTNDGYVRGDKISSKNYRLALDQEGVFSIDGEIAPKPVEVIDPSVEEGDRIMREEREAHERQEREIKERAERENRENNERIEREKEEARREQERLNKEAEKVREREKAENERLKEEAKRERERLNIKEPGEISNALDNPPSEDSNYLALVNLWDGQYAPYDADGFKERLKEIRQMSGFEQAVDEICNRLGWKL